MVPATSLLGKAFNDNRIIAIVWIVLPRSARRTLRPGTAPLP